MRTSRGYRLSRTKPQGPFKVGLAAAEIDAAAEWCPELEGLTDDELEIWRQV